MKKYFLLLFAIVSTSGCVAYVDPYPVYYTRPVYIEPAPFMIVNPHYGHFYRHW